MTILLGSLGLTAYIIWFVFINKCSLESTIVKTLAGVDTYKIEDKSDVIVSTIIHIFVAPIIVATLFISWYISIPTFIVYTIYKKKILKPVVTMLDILIVLTITVVLLADYGKGWGQGDEITVDRDHYVPVVKLSKRKPINEN